MSGQQAEVGRSQDGGHFAEMAHVKRTSARTFNIRCSPVVGVLMILTSDLTFHDSHYRIFPKSVQCSSMICALTTGETDN
jgi:hypothetical protein